MMERLIEIKKHNKKLRKELRDMRRRIIVCDLWFALDAYTEYRSLKINEGCLNVENPAYADAEQTAELCSVIFGRDFKAAHFIHSNGEIEETVIDHYTAYQKKLKQFEKTRLEPAKLADSFCRAIYHLQNPDVIHYELNLKNHLANIYQYLFGRISKQDLVGRLIDTDPYTGVKQGFSSMNFRKRLMCVIIIYTDIKARQEKRSVLTPIQPQQEKHDPTPM